MPDPANLARIAKVRSLVTGGTGFVGRRLLSHLNDAVVLTRSPEAASSKFGSLPKQPKVFGWDPETQRAPTSAFQGVEVVYHLAGEPVAEGRWTTEKRRRLVDSRIKGTRNLVDTLLKLPEKPRVLVSASAVGYYGDRGDEILEESDKPGRGFLPELCVDWEREALRASEGGIRVAPVRIGIVLGMEGGALKKMLPIFRKGLGSVLGSGTQFMPWIHIDDLVGLLMFAAAEPSMVGPVNGTSPHPVTNREFTKAVARATRSFHLLPAIPGFVLKLVLGEMGSMLLQSQQVLPREATRAGFRFEFPGLDAALENLVQTPSPAQEPAGRKDGQRAYSGAQANH